MVGKKKGNQMSKEEKSRNSSFSEKPVRSRLGRLVDWINLTGAKKVHSLIDKTDRGTKSALARVGRVLQTRPRPQTLPPTRWLDSATDLVASVQALEKWPLEATAQEDALPRARACQLSRAIPFVGISDQLSLRESCMREMCTCSLSGG
jgi:hypothetical protein